MPYGSTNAVRIYFWLKWFASICNVFCWCAFGGSSSALVCSCAMPRCLNVCVVSSCSGNMSYYNLLRHASVYDLKSAVKARTGVRIFAQRIFSGVVELGDTQALRELARLPSWCVIDDILADRVYFHSQIVVTSVVLQNECAFCLQTQGKLKQCGGCRTAFYCSDACQRLAWSTHKGECARLLQTRVGT